MRFFGRALCALVSLFVLTALPALADPRIEHATDEGASGGRSWSVALVQVREALPAVQERVNQALQAAKQHLIESRAEEQFMGLMDATTATDDVLSVTVVGIDGDPNLQEPKVSIKVLNFDMQSGKKLPSKDLFKPGGLPAVKDKLAQRICDKGLATTKAEALEKPLSQPAIDRDGLTFYTALSERVQLTWAEIREHVDFSGALRAFAPPQIDLALGAPAGSSQVESPTAAAMGVQESYLTALEDRLYDVIPALSVETKRQILRGSAWSQVPDLAGALAELEREGPAELATAVTQVRAELQEQFAADRDAFAAEERALIVDTVAELVELPSARVLGTQPLPLLAPDGSMRLLRMLEPGTVTGLETGDVDGRYHRVRTADGTRGLLANTRVLFESPFDAEARVYRLSDGALILALRVTAEGKPIGPRIVAKDGPGQPDAELEALAALVDPATGMSDPVAFEGIRRDMSGRASWVAVTGFELLEDEGGSGEGPGIVEQLGGE